MMRPLLVVVALLSCVWLPHGLAFGLAIVSASIEPLMPLAAGLLLDALGYTALSYGVPWWSLVGLAMSVGALFLRTRLSVPGYAL